MAFNFVDNASFIKILNLLLVGFTSFNCKNQITSDPSVDKLYLPTENTTSQSSLTKRNVLTKQNEIKLNAEKTKYMILNFYRPAQFQTRLYIEK